jgi:hypothetical protein
MEKSKRILKDIDDILSRHPKWNDLMIGRVRKTLLEVKETLNSQEQTIKIIKYRRSDNKYVRNIKIVEQWKKGETQADLARKYRLTPQRIHTIINTYDF